MCLDKMLLPPHHKLNVRKFSEGRKSGLSLFLVWAAIYIFLIVPQDSPKGSHAGVHQLQMGSETSQRVERVAQFKPRWATAVWNYIPEALGSHWRTSPATDFQLLVV